MAEKKSRAAARKIKDKWKAKAWYNVVAPEMFNRQLLGETPCDTPDKLVGRVTEVTVQDLTGDFSKMHIKLQFRVHNVQGSDALTHFVGHDLTTDYVRRLTRRKRTRIDGVFDVATKDNWKLRVKPMAIADRRIQSSRQRIIRDTMERVLREIAANATVGEFVKAIIGGDLAKQVAVACKPIQPMSRVEVRRSEVLEPGDVALAAPPPAASAGPPSPPEGPPPEEMPATGEPSPGEEEKAPEELPPDMDL